MILNRKKFGYYYDVRRLEELASDSSSAGVVTFDPIIIDVALNAASDEVLAVLSSRYTEAELASPVMERCVADFAVRNLFNRRLGDLPPVLSMAIQRSEIFFDLLKRGDAVLPTITAELPTIDDYELPSILSGNGYPE